jgi:hypothetical protein
MVNIVEENEELEKTLKDLPNIRELTPNEKRQLEFLCKEYPRLDEYMIETVLRLSNEARDKIVEEMKSGELKVVPDDFEKKEQTVLKNISVE